MIKLEKRRAVIHDLLSLLALAGHIFHLPFLTRSGLETVNIMKVRAAARTLDCRMQTVPRK